MRKFFIVQSLWNRLYEMETHNPAKVKIIAVNPWLKEILEIIFLNNSHSFFVGEQEIDYKPCSFQNRHSKKNYFEKVSVELLC